MRGFSTALAAAAVVWLSWACLPSSPDNASRNERSEQVADALVAIDHLSKNLEDGVLLALAPPELKRQVEQELYYLRLHVFTLGQSPAAEVVLLAGERLDNLTGLQWPVLDRAQAEELLQPVRSLLTEMAVTFDLALPITLLNEDFQASFGQLEIHHLADETPFIARADESWFTISGYDRNCVRERTDSWLVSPQLDAQALAEVSLEIKQKVRYFSSPEDMQVLVSLGYDHQQPPRPRDPSNPDDALGFWPVVELSPADVGDWQTFQPVVVPELAGQLFTMALRYQGRLVDCDPSANYAASSWQVDYIKVSGVAAEGQQP